MAKETAVKNRGRRDARDCKSRATALRAARVDDGASLAAAFSEPKSLEEHAAEQDTKPTRLEDILGKGADLWKSDQELEQFVEDIYARRREDRDPGKP